MGRIADMHVFGKLLRFFDRFSLDLRALAIFRIGLGTLLLVDLALRWRHVELLYTDEGISAPSWPDCHLRLFH